jgi:hypothetical protein
MTENDEKNEQNEKKLPFKSQILGTDRIQDDIKLPFKSRILGTDRFEASGKDSTGSSVTSSNTKKILGLIGAILLFLGVFMPIVSIPIMGNMNYFQNGKGDGVVIIILAIASVFWILLERYNALWFTGFASLGVLAFTFVTFQSRMSQVRSQIQKELADNPFRSLAEMATQSIQLQWGWALLVVGAVLIIAAAAIKEQR